MKSEWILGVDTSNYTTSLALTDRDGNVLEDLRKPLQVKQGERGLRQSEALFQHMNNLPELAEALFARKDGAGLKALAVSTRPRRTEGSYMPVFRAGMGFAKTLSAALSLPVFSYSHQEGHLAAAARGTPLEDAGEYLAWQLSGGTCELLRVREGKDTEILGGSLDISFGQVLDRAGVALGLTFPAGRALDEMALEQWASGSAPLKDSALGKVPVKGLFFNLSGLETQFSRKPEASLVLPLFYRLTEGLIQTTEAAVRETGCRQALFCGGVTASAFLRKQVQEHFRNSGILTAFGDPALSPDNAVGIALLGGKELWG